jgi:translation initiation factor 2B subunit (eIF-2B alpha/beta/delta family)
MASAARLELVGYTSVVTISNSSTVADALKLAALPLITVVVASPADEGHAMVSTLREAGMAAEAVAPGHFDADVGLVGCDAVFTDGSFVNRRGTADLAARLMPRVVFVLADPLRRLDHEAPDTWPEPDLFEIVPSAVNIRILADD